MQVACSKGCGFTLDVSSKAVETAIRSGDALDFSHGEGECPEDGNALVTDPTYYQVVVVVNRKLPGDEYPKRLMKSGKTITGTSLESCFARLTDALSESWAEVSKVHTIAEQDRP